ncbi:MAG: hypothetical protein DHS20C17_09400 [Cyclobacteriaceae bacterium]|nr:MAG: hypothetical protein DHS20C17_09400 [Cyclobacteriaceae bacterium]
MRYVNFYLCAVIAILVIACENPEEIVPEEVKFPGVDAELKEYFQRFEDEAATRGINVDLAAIGITGVILEIDETHVLGRCSFPRAQPNRVTVDQTFWNRGSDLFREFVVFHELGHCFLLRSHLEDQLPNGACSSIMRSGNGTCLDNYSSRTRNFYVDELFESKPRFVVNR